MTWALCCSCGEIKFGAIVPCPKCGVASTGDMNMDINFSDHYLAHSTLEQLGAVVKTINSATDDKGLRFYSFAFYVSENHPSILEYKPPEPQGKEIRELLASLDLPAVEIIEGRRTKRDTGEERKKQWWQFWKRGP